MAKLTFAAVTVDAHRGYLSRLRTILTEIAEKVRKSPTSVTDIALALAVLTAKLGVTLAAAGTPGQPTTQSAVLNGAGNVILLFAGGVNTTSFEYRKSTDGATGATFGAWTALPATRALTGLTAGAAVFQVRGVNAGANGAASANTASVTVT